MSKIICVGRNYEKHAKELGNEVPSEPVIFIKPFSAALFGESELTVPKNRGAVHHELELCLKIDKDLNSANPQESREAISEIALGLDLTLRDLQSELKAKSLPWERSKSFDQSAVFTDFAAIAKNVDLQDLDFNLKVNGEIRQQGNSRDMIFSCVELISFVSQEISLQVGDIIMTGTPEGVSALYEGDRLEVELTNYLTGEFSVK